MWYCISVVDYVDEMLFLELVRFTTCKVYTLRYDVIRDIPYFVRLRLRITYMFLYDIIMLSTLCFAFFPPGSVIAMQ